MVTFTKTKKEYKLTKEQLVQFWSWLHQKSTQYQYPLYSSLDLRISSFKSAVVDTNLFPAGFNNLCDSMLINAATYFREYIEAYYPNTKKITVFCEGHTRNNFYFEHIKALGKVIEMAGYNSFYVHPLLQGKVNDLNFQLSNLTETDLILVNNDFSGGYSHLLKNLGIPIVPKKDLIWLFRRKNQHFKIINSLSKELAELLGIDFWSITAFYNQQSKVDFLNEYSITQLKNKATILFKDINNRYSINHIKSDPVIFLKDDAGTYGMGIMTIKNTQELGTLNRKTLNKMTSGKQHMVQDILLQEAVPSELTFKDQTAEPVLYCIGNTIVGAFLRTNENRNSVQNLNSRGMQFYRICQRERLPKNHPMECTKKYLLSDQALIAAHVALLAAAVENSQ